MRFPVTHFDWRKPLDDGVGSAFKTSPRGCVTVVFEILMARGKRRLNRKIKKTKASSTNLHTENKHLREQKYIYHRVGSVSNPNVATYGVVSYVKKKKNNGRVPRDTGTRIDAEIVLDEMI